MGIYRRIEVRMWGDGKFKNLSPMPPSGQGLWIYLLCGPQTGIIPGLFCAGHAALAEALGWPTEAFEKAFREVLGEGLAKDSPKDRLIWLPNAIKHNPPMSPNVVRSWAAAMDSLPECTFLHEAIEHIRGEVYLLDKQEVKGFAKAFDEVFGEALPKAFAKGNEKPSPNQEQEQEQDSGTGEQQQQAAAPVDNSSENKVREAELLAIAFEKAKRKRGVKNPAGLARSMTQDPDVLEEYERRHKPPAPPLLAPVPGPCPICGAERRAARHEGVAQCLGCGKGFTYDRDFGEWFEDKAPSAGDDFEDIPSEGVG
jgi:hypothetical protein